MSKPITRKLLSRRNAVHGLDVCCRRGEPQILPALSCLPDGNEHGADSHCRDWCLPLQLLDGGDDNAKLIKYIVELLYGAGNKAGAMLPQMSFTHKADACKVFKRQMRRAALCAELVSACSAHANFFMKGISVGS